MVAADRRYNAPAKEPRSLLAGVLALLVHIVFIAVLISGFNWKDEHPESMIVDIWQDLPQPVPQSAIKKTASSAQPERQTKPAPETKPDSKPIAETKPHSLKPVPAQASPSPPKKPEIEIKEKAEKPKPAQKDPQPDLEVQKKKAQEQETRKKAEAERLLREREEQKKRELDAQNKRAQEDQQKRETAAQQKHEQEEKARLEARQAAARAQVAGEISKYQAMILAKIKSRIVMPPNLPGNPATEFDVTLLPGGDILDVRLRKSSGYPAFDSAVERAILLSKPLPLPPDPALFNEFRNLHVTVHYLE
ncbi:colicin import membrane protein [Nitrosomonas sp. Nm51]|uniref:cell envelope integrity protein TolA n=1 Tax=Nitrosomonas sp. Nm51 TaxID=133720 RepID=UPI0008CC8CF8|nr:cell envelope integrity protein TolA [Nitrosomonas sp. Nm51]SER15439.1 colicin import membrane protein [Nitrosomonas sp. Nm51]